MQMTPRQHTSPAMYGSPYRHYLPLRTRVKRAAAVLVTLALGLAVTYLVAGL